MFEDNGITFQDWQAILLSSLEVGGDYKQLLQKVNFWLKSLTKQKPLSPPLTEEKVPIFVEYTLPKMISQILDFGFITNYEETKFIHQFLKRIIKSIPSIRQYMNEELIKSIPRIFNFFEKLYQSNRNQDWFKDVYTCYHNQMDMLTAILDSMISNDPNGFIKFYILHISILTNLVKSKVNIQELNLENYFVHNFTEFIETQFQNPDFFSKNFEIISNAFDSLSKYLNTTNEDDSKNIKILFRFLQKKISNPHIEIQKFIAHCLSTLCQNPKLAQFIIAEQKEKSNSIFDNLISSDIQPETLTELQPFIQLQIEQGIINLKSLLQFWFVCCDSQFLNNNQVCVDLFAFSLKFLDSDSIRDFLSAIQINLSPFYYNVLAKTILELQNFERTINITITSIKILLSLALVDECARQVLLNLINFKLKNIVLHSLLDETVPLLEKNNDCINFACLILKRTINSSSDPSHLFDSEKSNLDQIMKRLNENNKNQIIDVLFQYHLKVGSKPSSKLINELLNDKSSDETWLFLRKLLKNKNYQNSEDLKELFQIAKKVNLETASHNYYKFLKILIFKISNNSFIESKGIMPVNDIHIPFKIKCNSIQGLDLMLQLYQFNSINPKTISSSKKFLLLLFKSWDPNLTVNYLNEQIQQLIVEVQSNSISDEQNEPLIRSLQLVLDYINEFEINSDPEDFNKQRHFYPRNSLLLDIHINSLFAKKSFTIHFDQQKTLKNLRDRIAEHENQSSSSIIFEDYQLNQEQLTLFELDIINHSPINIKINSYVELTQLHPHYQSSPSYLFFNCQFGDVLLNLLDENEKLNSIIWEILKLLPTAKSISELLNDPNHEESEIVENFISQLLKTENKYQKLYLIQSLSESNISVFSNSDLLKLIFSLFNDPFYKEEIIYLFDSKYHEDYFQEANIFLINLIHFIPKTNNDDLIGVIFHLINRIAKENDFNSLSESLNIFEKLNNTFWRNIFNFIQIVNEHHNYGGDIFDFCLSRIVNDEGNFRFALNLLSNCVKYIDIKQADFLYKNLIGRVQNYCELIEKENYKFQNGEDLRVFSNILDSIVSIIDQFPSLIIENQFPISSLFNIAFGQQYNSTQNQIFHIILATLKSQPNNESKSSIISKLNKMINYPIERWNYNPSIFARNAPYTGLRNLGATCFLNSILQQMFHLFPVRYFISTFEFKEDDELRTLQRLFIQMAFTTRSFSDTSKFIETWHGWNKSLLNPKEQQDAVELFLALKDSLPTKITDMFKGEMKNFLQGIGVSFDNSSPETFYNLSISIKNHKNIESSFDEFIQEEQVSDYECEEMNKQKISVKKYLRISKLPSILVIQLTRFEYNFSSQVRYKINDRFEFPLSLNIKKLCENQNEDDENKFIYNLSGIVIHTGVATGGHYISNIRKGDDWWCFNDIDVTKMSEKDVLNNAYGGKEGNSSAYVLFYTKSDYFTIEKSKNNDVEHRISFDNEFDYSNEVDGLNEIFEDNEIFEKSQALFGSYVVDFVQGFDDPLMNLSFYIKVLCHSRNYQKASNFISHLKEIIDSNDDKKLNILIECADFLNAHIIDIVNNYINCSQDALIFNLSDIILYCFTSLDKLSNDDNNSNEKSFEFFKNFADVVSQHVNSYRQLPAMLSLIRKYISNHIFEAFKEGWVQILLSILEAVYGSQISRSQNILNNLNLSDLFTTLNAILSKVPTLNYDISTDLLKHAMDIKLSDANKNSFTSLLITCIVNHNANVSKIKGIIPINTDQIKKKLLENIKEIILDPKPYIESLKSKEKEKEEKINKEESSTTEPFISITIINDDDSKTITLDKTKEEKEEVKSEVKEEEKEEEEDVVDEIKDIINDYIKKEFFTENDFTNLIQSEIRNQNEKFIKKIVEYSPQIFADKVINSSSNISNTYTLIYKSLFDKVRNLTDSKQLIQSLLNSFDDYFESIIFDKEKLINYIPKSPQINLINYTLDRFVMNNYIDLLKILITQQKDYTNERVEKIIKMIKVIDETKRIFIDYTIHNLMNILSTFPRELFKGKLHDIVINYFLCRVADAKVDQISKEIEPILSILYKVLKIEDQITKTLEIDSNDEYFNEVVELIKDESLQLFTVQYITNTLKNSTQCTLYPTSSNYCFSEKSKKLFRIFLCLGEKSPEMKEICKKMTIDCLQIFDKNKTPFETKIKLFLFYYEIISEVIDSSSITNIFNEFINIVNKNGSPFSRNMDLFRQFIDIISKISFDEKFDEINADINFFIKFSTSYSQIGVRESTKKIINWLYFNSTYVHDNIVKILTEIISQKSVNQQSTYLDVAIQYCIQKKDAKLLSEFFNIAKKNYEKGKAYQILTRIVNDKFGADLFKFDINNNQHINKEEQNKVEKQDKIESEQKDQQNGENKDQQNDENKDQQNDENKDQQNDENKGQQNDENKDKQNDENKDKQNDDSSKNKFDWIAPFIQSNWDSYEKSYEEEQAISFLLKNMSDEIRIKLLLAAEDRYFYANSIDVKNKISKVLMHLIQNCKDIISLYKQKTKFTKEMEKEKLANLQEKFYIGNFLKLLFQS